MSKREGLGCWQVIAVLATAGALAAGTSSCSGCSDKAPLAFVPADAVGVVVVPSISSAIRKLEKASEPFKQGMIGGALLDRQAAQLEAELGFNPRKPQTMKKVGIDPTRGMVAWLTPDERASVVLGVANQASLDKYLRKQLQKATRGAATFKNKTISQTKLTVVSMEGREDIAAWTFVGGKHLVIGGGKQGGASSYVAGLTKLERTIKDNATFVTTRKELGKVEAMLYVDGKAVGKMINKRFDRGLETASDWMKKYIRERKQTSSAALAYFAGVGLGLELAERRVALKGYYAAPSAGKAKVIREIVSGEGKAAALAKYIGADALIATRSAINLKKLMERSLEILPSSRKRRIYRKLERAERENNLSFEKDILGRLTGRAALAVYPPKAGVLATPPRRISDATQAVPLALLVEVKDDKGVAELLNRLERFMVMKGADVRPLSQGQGKRYTLQREGKAVASWTVHKKLLVVASGDRLNKTLALIDKGGENILSRVDSKRAKAGLKSDDGIVMHVDVKKIADTIRGLNLGMELKVMLAPVFSALAKFKDITTTVEPAGEGLAGALEVRFN